MKQRIKSKNNKKIILAFFVLIAFLLIALYIIIGSFLKEEQNQHFQKISPTPQLKSNSYYSQILKITIEVPNDISIKEENVLRELILEKNGGVIKIHRYSTNRTYETIKEFLDELYSASDAPLNIVRTQIQIDGRECEISLGEYKNYDCYLDNNSFLSIYTDSPELYSDLDQIAQSFRYEPGI